MSGTNEAAGEAPPETLSPADLGWSGKKAVVGNVLIATLLAFLMMDGLPSGWPGHQQINSKIIDPVVYPLGLAQGSWALFAPNPDHINAYVEGVVHYGDGSKFVWKSWDYKTGGFVKQFIKARHAKAADYFRMDSHKAIWPSLANWVVNQAPDKPGTAKTKVELIRHWWQVPKAADLEQDKAQYESYPPPRDKYPNHYTYYTRRLR